MSVAVLSLSQLYPSAERPASGIFVHRRLAALPDDLSVRVYRLAPSFPVLRPAPPTAEEVVDGVPVRNLPYFYLPRVLKRLDGAFAARGLARAELAGVDVLDAHFGYPAGDAATRVGRARGLPAVVTFRGSELPFSREPARRARLEATVRRASRVVAVCRSLADLAIELGAPASRVHAIGNGVDAERFFPGDRAAAREALGLDVAAEVLLTVGGLAERKGVARVLGLLPALVARRPRLVYHVVGGGGPEGDEGGRLAARVQELGLSRHVVFHGRVDPALLPDFHRAADVFVLATRNEGWANVLHEALACGAAVVTTDVGGNREVLGEGRHGLLVPFGDSEALAGAIERALEGAVDTAAAARFARARTWSVVGAETAEVLRAAAAEGPR